MPKQTPLQPDGITSLSPQRATLISNAGRTKVYADDREGANVVDAARMWGNQVDRKTTAAESRVEWVRNLHSSSPVVEQNDLPLGPQQAPQRNNDGAMLFEMDVPAVAYGTVTTGGIPGVQMGPMDLTSPKAAVTSAMAEEDTGAAHARDVAAIAERMDNIETERIPCPRLCGATFGPGIGGLAMFNNGDVKKMWLWYDRAGSSRLGGIPQSIRAFSNPGSADGLASNGTQDGMGLEVSIPRDCPRTMKDMMDMATAAKEAQWGGEVNDGDGGADSEQQSSADNFFEYMSTGSLSSDSDADSNAAEGDKYDQYFGSYRRPLALISGSKQSEDDGQHSQASRPNSAGASGKVQAAGPSSDTLAPSVHVRHDFTALALNGQCPELAREWELGQWQAEEAYTVIKNQESVPQRSSFSDSNLFKRFNGDRLELSESPSRGRTQLFVLHSSFLTRFIHD